MSTLPTPEAEQPSRLRRGWMLRLAALARFLALGLGAGLLYFALRHAPLKAIWEAVRGLAAWQIGLVIMLDVLIYALMAGRWWLIVRAEDAAVPYLPLMGVRLAVFGVSYFTLGPQIGGEPLQVLYLRRQRGATFTRATASVILDKLFELLANSMLLALGLAATLRSGILSGIASFSIVGAFMLVALAAWPALHILLLANYRYPLSKLFAALPGLRRNARLPRFVNAAERLAGRFCRRHRAELIGAILVSLAAGAAGVIQYMLITSFLSIHMNLSQSVAAWTAGWLSFLAPVPAGLGVLEGSQIFMLGFFGVTAASAVAVALVMRGRDLIVGGVGLWLAGLLSAGSRSAPRSADVILSAEPAPRAALAPQEADVTLDQDHE